MKPPLQPPRVRLLIVDAGRLAMIRRNRGGRVYYTLPGGGVEPGESFEEAGRREAWEELGVDVEVTGEPYDETFGDHRFIYYRAHIVAGQFGTGEWPDHQVKPEAWRAERGSYEACWIELDRLDDLENGPALRALLAGRPLIRMDRFNHLTLTVADPERSRRFYIQMLGLVPSTFSDGRIGVRSTHQWIEFRRGDGRSDRRVDISFVSAVPLGLVMEHLRENGVGIEQGPITRQDWLGEMTLIALRDPDGNLIEVATYDGL